MTESDIKAEAQTMWKNAEVLRAAGEIIKAGLAECHKGAVVFGPDNIPDSVSFDGQGIVGVACRMLRKAGLIQYSLRDAPDEGIHHGHRISLRKSGNGREVRVYFLTSCGLAEAFLRRHGIEFAERQPELPLN